MTEAEAQKEAERRWPDQNPFAYQWTNRCYVGYMSLAQAHRFSGATFEAAFMAADGERQ